MITNIGQRKWNTQICLRYHNNLQSIHSMGGEKSLKSVALSSVLYGWCLYRSVQCPGAASLTGPGVTSYSWYCNKGIKALGKIQTAQLFVLEQKRAQDLLLIPNWKSEAYHLFFGVNPMKITLRNQAEIVSSATSSS